MKKILLFLAKVFGVSLIETRTETIEVVKIMPINGVIDGDVIIKGNVVVEGNVKVNGSLTCLNNL